MSFNLFLGTFTSLCGVVGFGPLLYLCVFEYACARVRVCAHFQLSDYYDFQVYAYKTVERKSDHIQAFEKYLSPIRISPCKMTHLSISTPTPPDTFHSMFS